MNDANALDARRLAGPGGGLWGGPAYFNGPAGPTVYTQINGDVLRAFSVPVNLARPAFLTQALGTSKGGYGGSLPIVSSNAATPHTGVVRVVRRSAPIELEAYDAGRLGQPIYSANIGDWSNPDNNNPFLTAMEANGRVYVATYLAVQVFGLTQLGLKRHLGVLTARHPWRGRARGLRVGATQGEPVRESFRLRRSGPGASGPGASGFRLFETR